MAQGKLSCSKSGVSRPLSPTIQQLPGSGRAEHKSSCHHGERLEVPLVARPLGHHGAGGLSLRELSLSKHEVLS